MAGIAVGVPIAHGPDLRHSGRANVVYSNLVGRSSAAIHRLACIARAFADAGQPVEVRERGGMLQDDIGKS